MRIRGRDQIATLRGRSTLWLAAAFALASCSCEPSPTEETARPNVSPPAPPTPVMINPGVRRRIEIAGRFDAETGIGETTQGLFRDRGECRSPMAIGVTSTHVRAVVLDGAGGVLEERMFQSAALSHSPREHLFFGCISADPSARRVIVRRGEQVFLDVTASAHRPAVRVVFPRAGDTVDRVKGTHLRWKATDPEGDPVWVRFSTTHDGLQWFEHSSPTLRSPIGPFSVPSNRMALRSGRDTNLVFLEVEASDGFWSTSEIVGPFRVLDCPAPAGFPRELDACVQRDYWP